MRAVFFSSVFSFCKVKTTFNENERITGIARKSGNRKYPRLSFVQYLQTGASQRYKTWHEIF